MSFVAELGSYKLDVPKLPSYFLLNVGPFLLNLRYVLVLYFPKFRSVTAGMCQWVRG
jgi:hypothetical protein